MEGIRSSKNQIEAFKASYVWLDIVDELNELLRRTTLEYDLVGEYHLDDDGGKVIPTTAETLIHLGDIKGRKKAINYFRSLPDILTQMAEDKQKSRRKKEVSNG